MSKLIFGCGYLGSRVATRWLAKGEEVFVVTRSTERALRFSREGCQPLVADVLRPESLVGLPAADTVLYAVGFDRKAGVSMHQLYVSGLRSVLDALSTETEKFVYVSTTGVYGQSQGEWVDEDSPCEPQREGGRVALEAEQLLASHALGNRAVVLRMAGLYGPHRVPYIAEIKNQQPIAVPGSGFLNLIHVDDAASVVVAAAERAATPRTILVSDGNPVERRAYFEEIARQLNAPSPCLAPPSLTSPAAVRAAASKRVNNSRLLSELNISLAYPTYRQGLAAVLATATPDK